MWSPWRHQYIESFKNEKGNEGCIFCNAVKEKINDEDCLVVSQKKRTLVMLNLYPYNNGHLMIVPFRHAPSIIELTEKELTNAMILIRHSIVILSKIMKPQGFNIGANIGKAAGAGIDSHIHFHVVPRWNGDTNFMPVLAEAKVISQDLIQTKNALVKEFKNLRL